MIEEWLPITDYEGFYEVSSLGRVRSVDRVLRYVCGERTVTRKQAGVIIGQSSPSSDGYSRALLRRDGGQKMVVVHRVVGRTFLADQRNALHNELAHLDGNRTNPRADNLKWVSKVENRSHRRLHGTHNAGSAAWNAKLTEARVLNIKIQLGRGRRVSDLARENAVTVHCIDSIRRGRNWRHVKVSDYRKKGGDQ